MLDIRKMQVSFRKMNSKDKNSLLSLKNMFDYISIVKKYPPSPVGSGSAYAQYHGNNYMTIEDSYKKLIRSNACLSSDGGSEEYEQYIIEIYNEIQRNEGAKYIISFCEEYSGCCIYPITKEEFEKVNKMIHRIRKLQEDSEHLESS